MTKPNNVKLTTAEFVTSAKRIHGSYFNYNKTKYVSAAKRLVITHPLYGDFKQLPGGHLTTTKPRIELSKKQCLSVARHCNGRIEFKTKFSQAYAVAKRMGWLDSCLSLIPKDVMIWTIEACMLDAQAYETRSEWAKSSMSGYRAACTHKILDVCCTHMKQIQKPSSYWTKEICVAEARKYQTRTEWRSGSSITYLKSLANGWHEECCARMKVLGSKYYRAIYVMIFSDRHVYVGLTLNTENRHASHLLTGPVSRHMEKSNLTARYKILTDYVPVKQAQILEAYYQKEYERKGYIPLHTAKAGGIGSLERYYTKADCIKYAKKYKISKIWKKKHPNSYNAAVRHKWLKFCRKYMNNLQRSTKYTLEKCIALAKRYKTLKVWHEHNPSSIAAARKYGYFEQCVKHAPPSRKPHGYWTKRICVEEAAKYSNTSEWKRKNLASYMNASKRGFLAACTKHFKRVSTQIWTKEASIADAKRFTTYTDWRNENKSYQAVRRNGWLNDCKVAILGV